MSDKYDILKKYFGYDEFREGQEKVIDGILSSRDALGIMPTGAGKSICYQIPALLFKGITVVVSPLISLMKDQVTALNDVGIRSAYLNSSLKPNQFAKALDNAKNGAYKLIYVSPERLLTDSFLEFACSADISLVSIDEAHCVSQWGQDFRPSYLKISEFIDRLPARPVVCAFTATATKHVRNDIIKYLCLDNPIQITTGFNRKNLYFEVQTPKNKMEAVLRIINSCTGQSGIIYCSTRKNVESVCDNLNALEISATKYHAGLSDIQRTTSQESFIYDKVKVMVATNAFGMGIDKSNVSFVIHYNMPKNIESYYQEAGRAGRDGASARCTLLFSLKDIQTNKFLIENSGREEPDDEMTEIIKKNELRLLNAMIGYCKTSSCLREYILNYFGEKTAVKCDNCSNCSAEFEHIDITVDSKKILSCIVRMDENYGKNKIISVLRGKSDIYMNISTYGIMKDVKKEKISEIIDFLILNDYIRQTDEFKSIIKINPISKNILFGNERLQMKFRKAVLESIPDKGGDNPLMFAKLKELRAKIAAVQSVPAYIVFTDSTLNNMCRYMPVTKDEFLNISGVGLIKYEKYGEEFISAIINYIKEAGIDKEIE